MNRRLVTCSVTCLIAAAGGFLAVQTPTASADEDQLRATLRDPRGHVVGTVRFGFGERGVSVRAQIRPNPFVAPGAFHGFHIHANLDPANGSGCIADPTAPSSTWFVSVDGHFAAPGRTHGMHAGDLPSPLLLADGSALLRFVTDRANPSDLLGRAVVLHAGPDNFGNVPTGSAADQYTANSSAAIDKTAKTGNAGDRVACGVITR
jgi:Cu-Zn family superoxide dismutase